MKWNLDQPSFINYCELLINPVKHDEPNDSCIETKKNHAFSGYGNINTTTWSLLLKHAINRDIEVDVTIEDVWKLFLTQKGYCALTGLPIEFKYKANTASLDRIDSTKPYTINNVQWVHKDINTKIKKDLDESILLEYAELVVNKGEL
jgi:hypothetical protein